MRNDERLLFGELAQHAGVNRETLCYYERKGLLRPARRAAAGCRVKDRESAARHPAESDYPTATGEPLFLALRDWPLKVR